MHYHAIYKKKMYMTTCRCKLAYDWVTRCQETSLFYDTKEFYD